MPPNAYSRRGSHLREHLLFLLLLLTLNVFAPPALAQNAPPAPADKSEQQKAAYAALAHRYGMTPAELAVAFVASRPFVGSTIVGATTLAQLEVNLKACARKLDPEVVAEIDAVHLKFTNPAP